MVKSSTVTVRDNPVEDVASAKVGGLTIHGETIVVQTDNRVELVDLTNRVAHAVWKRGAVARGAHQKRHTLRARLLPVRHMKEPSGLFVHRRIL